MLNLLLEKIKAGKIISREMFDQADMDELLDLRDAPAFDAAWMRVFNRLKDLSCPGTDREIIDEIGKASYLKAYEVSKSSEIASCVSDDFNLFARAYVASISDRWLNSVMLKYAGNTFPCGEIEQIEMNMDEVFQRLLK